MELTKGEQIALLRDDVQRTFVSQGMVADLALHRDNPENPHAHILLSTRELTADGFGAKRRDWNDRAELAEKVAEQRAIAAENGRRNERSRDRFTTREMLSIERSLLERVERLAVGQTHAVSARYREQVLADGRLSTQQREAFEQVAGGSDLSVLVGIAGAGKSTMLESARRAWEAAGRLNKLGGRADLQRCSDERRLCVRVDPTAGRFGKHSDYYVINGY
jgi:hypothetical protein